MSKIACLNCGGSHAWPEGCPRRGRAPSNPRPASLRPVQCSTCVLVAVTRGGRDKHGAGHHAGELLLAHDFNPARALQHAPDGSDFWSRKVRVLLESARRNDPHWCAGFTRENWISWEASIGIKAWETFVYGGAS